MPFFFAVGRFIVFLLYTQSKNHVFRVLWRTFLHQCQNLSKKTVVPPRNCYLLGQRKAVYPSQAQIDTHDQNSDTNTCQGTQWRNPGFPRNYMPTPKGAPTYCFTFLLKTAENNKFWPRKCASLPPPPLPPPHPHPPKIRQWTISRIGGVRCKVLIILLFALYIYIKSLLYVGSPCFRWSVSPEMFLWLHLINSVTVDCTGARGHTQCLQRL